MKVGITKPNYTWDNATATLTLSDYSSVGVKKERLLAVVNATTKAVMYKINDTAIPVSVTAPNKFVFTGLSNSGWTNDIELYIVYEDPRYDLGKTDDGATFGDTSGSLISKIRGLSTILNDVWNSSTHSFNFDFGGKIGGEDTDNDIMATLSKPINAFEYATQNYSYWAGSATKANIKAQSANVYSVKFINRNASVRYAQLFNKATAPVAGDTPLISEPIPAGTTNNPGELVLTSQFFAPSEFFPLGLGWAVSTTQGTLTDSATAADHACHVRYM